MLNDSERDSLQVLLSNDLLLRVVRKVFDMTVNENNPLVTETDNNAVLGEKYRAFVSSKDIVDNAFKNLESYKSVQKDKLTPTRAR